MLLNYDDDKTFHQNTIRKIQAKCKGQRKFTLLYKTETGRIKCLRGRWTETTAGTEDTGTTPQHPAFLQGTSCQILHAQVGLRHPPSCCSETLHSVIKV